MQQVSATTATVIHLVPRCSSNRPVHGYGIKVHDMVIRIISHLSCKENKTATYLSQKLLYLEQNLKAQSKQQSL